MDTLVAIIVNAISMGVIFLFGCVGEIFTEKAGHLNLGIPGIMCIGAAGGGLGVYLFNKASAPVLVIMSILLCMVFAGLAGMLYAFLTVTLYANQNVTGLALTTFGVGFMKFFSQSVYVQKVFVDVSPAFKNFFGSLGSSSNPLVRIFLSHGVLVYIAVIVAVWASFFLKKTKTGLYLRSIGENPATADAVGINVNKYKYIFITLGSAIAGLGGLYYIMDRSGGTQLAEASIDAFGWMAIALVIASMWKPLLALVGSIIFGGLSILDVQLTGLTLADKKIFALFPYILTVLVLVVSSMLKTKENQPPAALGTNYFREDR